MRLCFALVALGLIEAVHGMNEQKPSFRINFGSCHDIRKVKNAEDSGIWNHIMAREPDAFVWGGDNVYADVRPHGAYDIIKTMILDYKHTLEHVFPYYPTDKEYLSAMYQKTENLPEYKRFVEHLGMENIYGTWDDHDYGLNDAGGEYELKDAAQEAFLDFFRVPMDDPRRAQKGVYNSAKLNDGKIKLILLDNRYHRDTYSNASGDFLGEDQWTWFEKELNEDIEGVEVTLVVSGLQMVPDDHIRGANFESYIKLPKAHDRLMRTLQASKSKSIFLISGDVHCAEMMAAKCSSRDEKVKFLIPEMTTSGMTHSWKTYPFFMPILKNYMEFMSKSPYQIDNKFFLHKNFGEIDFFLNQNPEEKFLISRIFTHTGDLVFETRFDLKQLKPAASVTDSTCTPYNEVSPLIRTVRNVVMYLIFYLFMGALVLSCIYICYFVLSSMLFYGSNMKNLFKPPKLKLM